MATIPLPRYPMEQKTRKACGSAGFPLIPGGEGGIRTHGRLLPTPDFESGTFDHSATSPGRGF
jgi:hypothetical protein